jgi:hypothetical protein
MDAEPKYERRPFQFSLTGLFCITLLVAIWAWEMRDRFATIAVAEWLTSGLATIFAIGWFLKRRHRTGDDRPPPVAFDPTAHDSRKPRT